jgi:hypothetical protein
MFLLFGACNSRKLNNDSYEGSAKTNGYNEKPLPPTEFAVTKFSDGSNANAGLLLKQVL